MVAGGAESAMHPLSVELDLPPARAPPRCCVDEMRRTYDESISHEMTTSEKPCQAGSTADS